MKRFSALILCVALLLTPLCSCSKKTNFAKILPGTTWDNHSYGVSIIFEKDGICTVSNAISNEKCVYSIYETNLTIQGALSSWKGNLSEDYIEIVGMKGLFEMTKERSYYPMEGTFGYVIGTQSDEDEGTMYDLSFWYGIYECPVGQLTIGSSNANNTLTYTLSMDSGEITNGSIMPTEANRFVLENSSIRITLMENGAMLESLDSHHTAYEATYIKK